ncbi:MAG: hypothetical protein KKE64_05620, partial [Candidatus Omnitrophica bacterium]|nr:hypothetical protein [Candidatus Omnitrophota bacterium]
SHKIELFTYTVSSGRFFSVENLNLRFDQTSSIKDLFKNYLTALDSYVRWHFLPTGYEKKEFMEAKEQFYNLSLQLAKNKESCLAGFVLPPGYAWPKDLSYACRRINEKEVFTSDGLRLYINPG